MESFVLLAYASLTASRTLLQWLLAYLNSTLDTEDLFYWNKWKKKKFLWTMAAAQAAENHKNEWGLTWCLQWGIYTSISTWMHSQNSLAAAEALSLMISSHGTFLKWSWRLSQSAQEYSHNLCNKTGHPVVNLMESHWKLRQKHDQNFPMEGKPL